MYPIGLLIFAIYPALKSGSLTTALNPRLGDPEKLDMVVEAGRRRLGHDPRGGKCSPRLRRGHAIRGRTLTWVSLTAVSAKKGRILR